MADPASGATLTYTYNPMSQVSQVAYGGTGTEHPLARLRQPAPADQRHPHPRQHHPRLGQLRVQPGRVPDVQDHHRARRGVSQYLRLRPGGPAHLLDQRHRHHGYAYDGAGNRIQAGSVSYTYDARDQLTSDGTSSYAYTANGDLTTVTGPSGTTASTTDAYGQQGAQGTQASTYDALGRDTAAHRPSGTPPPPCPTRAPAARPPATAPARYTYTPGGTLTGTAPAAAPGTGVLDLTDHHTDLTAQFTASGTTLTGSRTYGPWGATVASGGTLTGSLGYQSQYTSPATGQVNMGARWYNPASGSFGNKDTVTNKPVPDSASASPFGYAADNPLGNTDPTGHQTDAAQLANEKAAAIAAAAKSGPVKVAVAVTSVKTAKANAAAESAAAKIGPVKVAVAVTSETAKANAAAAKTGPGDRRRGGTSSTIRPSGTGSIRQCQRKHRQIAQQVVSDAVQGIWPSKRAQAERLASRQILQSSSGIHSEESRSVPTSSAGCLVITL